jgi:perosamine synthetase
VILHSKPWINEDDRKAVAETLLSGMIGQGEKVIEFENAFSDWVGGKGGVAISSGAAAIYLALQTLAVTKSNEIILPTYVCESVLEAVLASGAAPVLCDVGDNWVIEPGNIEKLISSKTAAIIVPHMYGIFADVKSFKKFNFPVIEDCAQAVGDKKIDTIESDIAIFSFHPTKCLTTGEGGMLVLKKNELLQKARTIRDGDKKNISARFLSPMSDIQASLGISQLKRYPDFLKTRREIAGKYLTHLAAINMKLVNYEAKASSMFFRLPVKINGGTEKYIPLFEKEKIHVRKGVDKLLHRILNLPDKNFPKAVELFETTVSLPLYPAMTEEEINHCLNTIKLLK